MSEIYTDPYAPARAHIELAVEALNLPHAIAERLRSHHEGAMILDPLTGSQAYVNGAVDTGSWLRSLEQRDPTMLGKSRTTLTKAPGPADLSGETVTALMASAKQGDAKASVELERRMRVGDGTPKPAFNLTTTMAKAKAGDAEARRQLDNYFSTNRTNR